MRQNFCHEEFSENQEKLINNQVILTNRTPFVNMNPPSRNPGVAPVMLVIRTAIRKIFVKKTNREDPDQTASSEAVRSGTALFVWVFLVLV